MGDERKQHQGEEGEKRKTAAEGEDDKSGMKIKCRMTLHLWSMGTILRG